MEYPNEVRVAGLFNLEGFENLKMEADSDLGFYNTYLDGDEKLKVSTSSMACGFTQNNERKFRI